MLFAKLAGACLHYFHFGGGHFSYSLSAELALQFKTFALLIFSFLVKHTMIQKHTHTVHGQALTHHHYRQADREHYVTLELCALVCLLLRGEKSARPHRLLVHFSERA